MTKVFGFRRALSAGVLMTSRFGLAIAIGQIGMQLNIISPAINAGIVVTGIIICIVSPALYKMLNDVSKKTHKIYIVGGSDVAGLVAERIKLHGMACIVIESRGDAWYKLQEKGIEVMHVNVTSLEVYQSLDIRTSELVIVLTESVKKNQIITSLLKDKLGHNKVITIGTPEEADASETQYIQIDSVLASHVENLIMRPSSIQSLTESFGQYSVEEIPMTNKKLDGKQVKKVAFPETGSLVMVRRKQEIFIPHGDTHLLLGDIITVIGNATALIEFRNKLV
jgi:Trk K+ transport system NAD-binding subunit